MIALSGADLVLPDRIVHGGSILIEHGRIAAIESRVIDERAAGITVTPFRNHVIVPGLIDVHVHGIEGVDVLARAGAVADVARRLPKYGVTAFCPTSVACAPSTLTTFLTAVGHARSASTALASRVLAAHLESNFINPDWSGAQPVGCLRTAQGAMGAYGASGAKEFSGRDILEVIEAHGSSVAIVTLAPELPGGMDLVRHLVSLGHRVSIGHSGATYEQAVEAIQAGARHATHLFNRMSSITSRSPGVVGAVLESGDVTAEIICDGHHVHPSLVSLAIRLKTAAKMIAITDATAAAGLPPGSRSQLGGQTIIAGEKTALLENGTLAGSILTMDAAFRMLVQRLGLSLPDAARMCSTTPADAVKAGDIGSIAPGKFADLVVLDRDLRVTRTYIGGHSLEPH
jgi:N-acetylglucosamine-6-phosphate deacetylase